MNAPDALTSAGGWTEDAFLGGRFTLRQPARGLRAGSDALFLAAAVPARPGERLVEAGIGTGAAALSLLARVPRTQVTGIEIDPNHAALARSNAAANGFGERVEVIEADVAALTPDLLRARGIAPGFDHALANPPFHDEGTARPPATASRHMAHIAPAGALDAWLARLADLITGGGTLTLIHRADALGQVLAALAGRLGGACVLPLAPRAGEDASRVIVQARKGARARPRLMAPLVLHEAGGAHTSQAEAVLRHGAALDLAGSPVAVVPIDRQEQ